MLAAVSRQNAPHDALRRKGPTRANHATASSGNATVHMGIATKADPGTKGRPQMLPSTLRAPTQGFAVSSARTADRREAHKIPRGPCLGAYSICSTTDPQKHVDTLVAIRKIIFKMKHIRISNTTTTHIHVGHHVVSGLKQHNDNAHTT